MSKDNYLIIASDHAGYALKTRLSDYLRAKGYELADLGTDSEERADYPDYAHPLAALVESEEALGILICGSANGVNMTANKHEGIRSAIAWTPEIASLARQHNDANVLALPARFITEEEAEAIVDAFLASTFEGGRHADRVNKIALQHSEGEEI